MSNDPHSRGPWRIGGQAKFDGEKYHELATGRDIWSADGEPVTQLLDWFSDADLRLMSAAPEMRALIPRLRMLAFCDCPQNGDGQDHGRGCAIGETAALLARIDGGDGR